MIGNEKRPGGTNTGPQNGQRGSGAIANGTSEIIPNFASRSIRCNKIALESLRIEYKLASEWYDVLRTSGDEFEDLAVDVFQYGLIPTFQRLSKLEAQNG